MRRTCTFCGAKRNIEKMTQIEYKLLGKKAWVCSHHVSSFEDILSIRKNHEKPVFVELFAGSKEISNVAESVGFKTVTVDIETKYNPDIVIDIQNLRRSALPKDVHVLWASVPCTTYSILSCAHHWHKTNIGYRQYYYHPKTKKAVEALRILHKTIRLIKEINPIYYFIENPRGALRHFPQMLWIPYRHTVSYSDYGFNYYKPTDIWTNCSEWKPQKIRSSVGMKFENSVLELKDNHERSKVPGALVKEIISSIDHLL